MSTENKDNKKNKTDPAVEEEIKTEEIRSEELDGKEDKAADKKGEKKAQKKEPKKEEAKKEEPKKPEPEEKKPAEDYAALNDKYLRLCAEYDNFRKRSIRERDALYGDIKADTVTKFLPVYDNLIRALAQTTEDEAYRKGVEMILNQFNSTLEKMGVSKIDSLGKTFDPEFHNAVMHTEDESKGENEIAEVFQEGFLLGDKVIRFAMVKVAN